jgi:hypothetical protein
LESSRLNEEKSKVRANEGLTTASAKGLDTSRYSILSCTEDRRIQGLTTSIDVSGIHRHFDSFDADCVDLIRVLASRRIVF